MSRLRSELFHCGSWSEIIIIQVVLTVPRKGVMLISVCNLPIM
ncbi:hypothetical protein LINPERPRIM_LOCUS41159, partial [Linum perenne]